MRILLLGGTSEARELAARLEGHEVISSLAGRVAQPVLPDGDVRVGGFGGVGGLVDYLREHRIDAVVDATHPFAEHITDNAYAAAREAGVLHVLLRRPGFELRDEYVVVPDVHAAAAAIEPESHVFLTIGRQQVAAFLHVDAWFLVRAIDPPHALPPRHVLVLDRGPFEVADERALMERHTIDTLVTKDSGGEATAAKLVAAAELDVRVVVVARPPLPDGLEPVGTVDGVLDRLALLQAPPRPQSG